MPTPIDTVRDFYAAIAAGDSGKMISLMAPDIEWISVVDFDIQDKGPEEVMKKVFGPLMQEWESFSPNPSQFWWTVRPSSHSADSRACTVRRTSAPILRMRTCGMSRTEGLSVTVSTSTPWRSNR